MLFFKKRSQAISDQTIIAIHMLKNTEAVPSSFALPDSSCRSMPTRYTNGRIQQFYKRHNKIAENND